MKHILIICLLTAAGSFAVFGQSNQLMDDLLTAEKAQWGTSVYLVLMSAGMISEDATLEESLRTVEEKGWGFSDVPGDAPVNLGAFSYLVMKVYGMEGGIMFTLFPGPRYAAREFSYRGFISGNQSPYRILDGFEVVNCLTRALQWMDG